MAERNESLEKSFIAAYDSYSENILRHIYFRISDKKAAEDLTSEVFMKTWDYLRAGNKVKSMKSFLYKISDNLIIDHYRGRRPMESLEDIPELSRESPHVAPDNTAEIALTFEKAYKCLDEIPPAQKEIVIYRYIDDLTVSEIRALTGKSAANIYTSLHRGLKSLKTAIKKHENAS